MEKVCKEVDKAICVDLKNEEIQDIMEAVNIMIGRFVEALSNINNAIQIEGVELCGSMAEGTRIWKPKENPDCDLEFDYLALMKSWPGCGEFWFVPSYTEGEMQIRYDVIDPQSVWTERVYLNTDIKFAFINMLLKGVKSQCERNFCTRQMGGYLHNRGPGCECCTVYRETGILRSCDVPVTNENVKKASMLSFVWSTRKDRLDNPTRKSSLENRSFDLFARDKFKIDVDFHPVIKINNKRILPKDDGTSVEFNDTLSYFLFPYGLFNFNWRISTTTLELKRLKNTSEEHKQAFRVLKFIYNSLRNCCNLTYVEPYEAKCIILNHIQHCKHPRKGTHLCLLEMVKDIHDCTKSMILPHPIFSFNAFKLRRMDKGKRTSLCEAIFKLFDEQKEQYSTICLIYDLESLGQLKYYKGNVEDNINIKVYIDFVEKRRTTTAKKELVEIQKSNFVHKPFEMLFPNLIEPFIYV